MFKDKVIWITGASSGIGEALTYEFAKHGAKLVISARRKRELNKVKKATNLPEDNVLVVSMDLQHHNTMDAKVEEVVKHFGRIDLLVNNAGISQRSLAMETELEVDKKIMSINYFGTISLTKAVLPIMQKQGFGQIAAVTSLVGKFGSPLRSTYAASKHALHGFFDSLRAELSKENIDITLLCPGYIKTEISMNAVTGDGSPQNSMDDATENGLTPKLCAQKMIAAIHRKKQEAYIGQREVWAVYLKRFFPRIFSLFLQNAKVT